MLFCHYGSLGSSNGPHWSPMSNFFLEKYQYYSLYRDYWSQYIYPNAHMHTRIEKHTQMQVCCFAKSLSDETDALWNRTNKIQIPQHLSSFHLTAYLNMLFRERLKNLLSLIFFFKQTPSAMQKQNYLLERQAQYFHIFMIWGRGLNHQ